MSNAALQRHEPRAARATPQKLRAYLLQRGATYYFKRQGPQGAEHAFPQARGGQVWKSLDTEPIPGLYACGNDMDSVMNGAYPGPGITLGPALVFGYLAALHACGGGVCE